MSDWVLNYDGLDKEEESLREALCTLGNGYFASRGAAEESQADDIHNPGTYLAGGYNRLKSEVAGKLIENEDLVNWPNWLSLTFKVEGDKEWFSPDKTTVNKYHQELDLKKGLLTRSMHFTDALGRETHISSTRLVSMSNPHLGALKWEFTPLNWSGNIIVRWALDGSVKNAGVKRYAQLNSQHLEIIRQGEMEDGGLFLLVQANQARTYMAQAGSCRIFNEKDDEIPFTQESDHEAGKVFADIHLAAEEKKKIIVEKTVALFTSRDRAISEPLNDACEVLGERLRFSVLQQKHSEAWERLWKRFDISLTSPGNSQLLLRLHIFHLLQTCSMHTIGRDVGVPARGWHGEAYRGHIFWDELFIFPLLNFRMPDLTRSLLLYRYHRLNAARRLAAKAGLKGAMYPWQSGSSGREESQVVHLNPKSGEWVPDNTHLQRHVNLAIAYNIWQYYEATGNQYFMKYYGTEMLMEIARLFASITTWNEERERYDIRKVVGPDEFHTAYPGTEEPGMDNNAYTNVMASWLFAHALKAIKLVEPFRQGELKQKLGVDQKELDQWDEISRKLTVPFIEKGLIAQFEGYENLKEFDWEGYRKKHGNIQRLDRILDAEGDSVNNYKASKQADVLMLFYLFSSEELLELFQQLGYDFTASDIPQNIKHYVDRTSDGSTLSRIVRAWVEARSDRARAWQFFREAVVSDIEDVQGGTTAEGIHLGSMAGTVDIIQRCFTGLEIKEDVLWLNPRLPEEIQSLEMRLYYRGVWMAFRFSADYCRIQCEEADCPPVMMGLKGKKFQLTPGTTEVIHY